ncbi:MAG TPA: MmcQ/YjbR family DNA-binding protein [Burkholderiaceae bacterium]|nr:MmcQ/YjbR family DNA-binding protein [Burkholderiaceae bacterium]
MRPAAVRRAALALPEATEAPHFHRTSFRVRGRIFATLPPEATHLHVFVDESVREPTLALQAACVEPLRWGSKVVGLRVALAGAPPALVRSLLRQAWTAKAPKALVSAIG